MDFDSFIAEYSKHLHYNNRFTAFVRKITAEGFNPEIGIFWILPNNKIVGEKISLREASHSPSQFKDIEKSHDEVWNKNKIIWGHREDEYYEVPRGRVLFDAKARRFVLISSSAIVKDPVTVGKIMSFFNISQFEPILKADLHYENPADVDLFDED